MGGMVRLFRFTWVLFLLGAAPAPQVSGQGLLIADHPLGTQAGNEILAQGGNAVDAVVAAALAVGVVQPAGSGLGGGGFAVIVTPDGERHVLDFREVAPAKAHRDMYVESADENASRIGGLAVGVPGEGPGLARLHQRWGRLPLTQVAEPAERLASEGFVVERHLADALANAGTAGPKLARELFGADEVPRRGTRVRRAVLANTIAAFAESGGTALTTGAIADDIVAATRAAGGILESNDLRNYSTKSREPVTGRYRGWTVISMPPPSSGGVVLLQVLGALESSDLSVLGPNSAALFHRYAEAMKHGFADRARHMGDPDRNDVPVEAMLNPKRISEIRADFDPDKTYPSSHYGTPIDIGKDSGTQHISALDSEGLAVALTTTINTSFGSRVVGESSGVLLNNEMDDFVARPGVANHYGLVGSEANAVAPGARPLSSMSPTVLISPDGKERIVVGASGGPFIISSTLQVIVNLIDFGMDASEAVSLPRMHHQWAPDVLLVDRHTSPDTVKALETKGHTVREMRFFSSVQVVHGSASRVSGAADPRKR